MNKLSPFFVLAAFFFAAVSLTHPTQQQLDAFVGSIVSVLR